MVLRFIIAYLFISIAICGSAQIKLSVEGKDFWFTIMPNFGSSSPASDSVLLTVSSRQNTSGVIENISTGYSLPFSVNAFQVTEIPIPNSQVATLNSGIISNTAIHIVTEDTVTAFVASMQVATRDATNLIPTQALGKEYMITSWAAAPFGHSQFAVVATEDNMNVEITPACSTNNGQAAGVPFNVTLNQGETYLVQGATQHDTFDLTGSSISSLDSGTLCSNFAVFGGSSCTQIPSGCAACDQVFSIQTPTAAWGREYLLAPFEVDSISAYRILALNDSTPIYIDGVLDTVLNSSEYRTVLFDSNARCITSDSLISVAQYMHGFTCSSDGDPAMLMLNSSDQGVKDAIFTTIDVFGTGDTNFATLITNEAGIGEMEFDGNLLDSLDFIQFQECSDYYYTYIPLTIGAHTVHSNKEKFSLYIYGMTNADSYAYSAGASVFIQGEIRKETCSSSRVIFDGDSTLNNYWWYRLEDPTDTLSTELNLVMNAPIKSGLYVFAGYSPISGCTEEYFYKIREASKNVGGMALADPEFACNGQEVNLSILQRTGLKYSFDDSLNLNDFSFFSNVSIHDQCGALDFAALVFDGDFERVITTENLNSSQGGFIEFFASVGQEGCDLPEVTDKLVLEYSVSNGPWVRFDSLNPTNYPSFIQFQSQLPDAAENMNTRFRIRQIGNYTANEDIWLVDNFGVFIEPINLTDSIRWFPSSQVSDSTIKNPKGYTTDSTTFLVSFIDSLNCEYYDSIVVYSPPPLPSPVNLDTFKCDSATLTFNAIDGGHFYTWSPINGVSNPDSQYVQFRNVKSTEYVVKVVDQFRCDSTTQTVNIQINYPPAKTSFRDTALCDEGFLEITLPDTQASIEWNTGNRNPTILISETGLYHYEAINDCGITTDSIFVEKGANPYVDLGRPIKICPNQTITVKYDSLIGSYAWSDSTIGSTKRFTTPGTYAVSVTSNVGCLTLDSVIVTDDCEPLFFVMNVFTPNDDGLNDVFRVPNTNIANMHIRIYNRWGKRVYEQQGIDIAWDGKINNSIATDGTYFYVLEISTNDGRIIESRGDISLLKN